jgi:hypothetical protein
MVRKSLIACAAMLWPALANATTNQTQLITTADGTIWYLEDSSVMPLNLGRPGTVQFWLKSDNPAGQVVRHWGVRIYLYCPTRHHVASVVSGSDAAGKVIRFTTTGWAPANWTKEDSNGVIAAAAAKACPTG